VKQSENAAQHPTDDPFTKLAQSLGELEIVIGERARPTIVEVRAGLRDAMAARERGDMPVPSLRFAVQWKNWRRSAACSIRVKAQ